MRRLLQATSLVAALVVGLMTYRAAWSGPRLDRAAYTRETIVHEGRERSYYVHLPPAARDGKRVPLLILLHGGGGGAAQALTDYPLLPIADREGFALVAPNGTGPFSGEMLRTWKVGFGYGYAQRNRVDDNGFIRALVTHLRQTLPIDPSRVYLTGLSNGAILCHFAGAANADLIAGIAPVVGTAGGRDGASGALTWPVRPARPVDVIMFNGALDEHVPLDGGWSKKHADRQARFMASAQETARFWVDANGCAPTPKVEELPVQQATRYTWSGGRKGTRVVLYVLHNQGHAWPGGKPARIVADQPSPLLDAGEVLWTFFSSRKP